MVFQGLGLYEHLSVEENLAFGLKARSQETAESGKRKAEETARQLGIEHLLRRKPGELSGGEQQRVALGRALVRQPAALLLDEPLSSLDPPLRSELRQQLKELQRRLKVTTVYVTHDQAEAMSLGERIAVIRAGKIEQAGTPTEIYDQPRNRFVAGFFGEGGMNWERRKAESGKRTVLGVRPEDVVLKRGSEKTDGLKGTVSSVQWLGSHTMVDVELEQREREVEKVTWLSRVCGRADYQPGEKVSIEFVQEKEHWFAAESGERIERWQNPNNPTT
jgi:multiple sugar transport system ATP-binding protein